MKARQQNLVAKTSLESTVKLLLIVELDRAEQERATTVQRIKDGIKASNKKSGRPVGKLDKISDELKKDIQLFAYRGVQLILNGFLKSLEKLIAEKYNFSTKYCTLNSSFEFSTSHVTSEEPSSPSLLSGFVKV